MHQLFVDIEPAMTHEEVSKYLTLKYGKPITRQRIWQIENQALAKLRGELTGTNIEAEYRGKEPQ
jgi:DNA-directed RNA polymerase sigma subunit (sigma70/sigma32)